MVLSVLGNPIIITAAETWVCKGVNKTIKSMVWNTVTADGSSLVLSKDASSAESSQYCTRVGKQDIDISVYPEPVTFSYLYVQTMDSGQLEIHLD
jgi:hypothetical protein